MDINFKQVNISLQFLPRSSVHDTYQLVDKAIEVIKDSGLTFQVSPFETVMEGPYDKIMDVIRKVHEVCYQEGTENSLAFIKIQMDKKGDVTINDKLEKYR